MNERVKELRDEILAEAYQKQQGMDWVMEKFAELIVRECIYQVNKSNYSSGDECTLWDEAMTCAANNIREHFGVEE